MIQKCIKCGEPVAKIPIYTYREGKKVILWKNLFKMSWESIIFLVLITILILAYKHDTNKCMYAIKDPVSYCNQTNACIVLMKESMYVDPAGIPLFELPGIKDGENRQLP